MVRNLACRFAEATRLVAEHQQRFARADRNTGSIAGQRFRLAVAAPLRIALE